MHFSKYKLLNITYTIKVYTIVFAGLLIFSAIRIADMRIMNLGLPTKNSMPLLQQSNNMVPAIVELFTSEGCSSCPSADKLVALAQKEFNDNTIVLSYHVDYWDRLGWKDPFSKSIFSDRQRAYAQHLNLESIYTPQAIVNGRKEFLGSNKSALWNAINSYKISGNSFIEIETAPVNNKQLKVKYNYALLQKSENVVLELILKNATTQVKRGENSGATLAHINIVEDIIEKNESNGTAIFNLPANFAKENYMVVAFIQSKESFKISNAKRVSII